eukprot:UN30161
MIELRTRMGKLIDENFEPDDLDIFSTVNQTETIDHSAFFDSADKISYFVDMNYVKDGELTKDKEFCLNKVGHGLQLEDDVFKKFSQNCDLANVAMDLGMSIPTLTQTMYIFKQPDGGEYVQPHRDSWFLYTTPHSCMGFWWAVP